MRLERGYNTQSEGVDSGQSLLSAYISVIKEGGDRWKRLKKIFLLRFFCTCCIIAIVCAFVASMYDVISAEFSFPSFARTSNVQIDSNIESETMGEVVATDLILESSGQNIVQSNSDGTTDSRPTYLDIKEEDMNWYVKVNHIWNTVTVYTEYYPDSGEFDQPYKAFTVSVGIGDNTKLGIYEVGDNGKDEWRYEWQQMEGKKVTWTQYDVRFQESRLFHSPVYSKKGAHDTMSTSMFNNLGQAASHGCIRMRTGDAYWMYTHLTEGTTVEIYSDPESPGPLGKPAIQRITNACPAPYRTWDPTDPHPDNPWLTATDEQLALWLEDAVYQDPVTLKVAQSDSAVEAKPVYLVLTSDDGVLHLPTSPTYEQIKANFACYFGDDSSPVEWNLYFEGPHDLETPGVYTVQAYAMDVATNVRSAPITVTIWVEAAVLDEAA